MCSVSVIRVTQRDIDQQGNHPLAAAVFRQIPGATGFRLAHRGCDVEFSAGWAHYGLTHADNDWLDAHCLGYSVAPRTFHLSRR